LDVLAVGNSYAPEVSTGRYDAGLGWYLKGNGKGQFRVVPARESGWVADQDAKGLVQVSQGNAPALVVVGNNNRSLQVYRVKGRGSYYQASPTDAWAQVSLRNGKSYKHEFAYGNAYLSQNERSLKLTENITSLTVYEFSGEKRTIYPPLHAANQK
jgi:hypothetical protein